MKFFDLLNRVSSRPTIEMSSFDMSHEHKTSLAFGKIAPVFLQEVLPGDKWHISSSAFLRTMPLLSPMMHRLDLKLRFFFVPNRLIWSSWEAFISQGRASYAYGENSQEKELYVPSFAFDGHNGENNSLLKNTYGNRGSLMDYFGFPLPKNASGVRVSQLPFRAYHLIVKEYFRNNLLDTTNLYYSQVGPEKYGPYDQIVELDDKTIQDNSFLQDMLSVANLAWENDYFTSASPTPLAVEQSSSAGNYQYSDAVGNPASDYKFSNGSVLVDGVPRPELDVQSQKGDGVSVDELRYAYRLQHFLENGLKYGRRYAEQIFAHFGVTSSDSRLQRPEYLGGGSLAVQVSEVTSTAGADEGFLGDLAGRGLAVGGFEDITFTSEEHGFLIGVAYLSPHASYYGGINRTFLRSERFDFAFPEFADLGQQPIFESELDVTNNFELDGTREIFGYVPRYSEYKQVMDKFSGEMVDTLSYWHLGRDFSDASPKLNDSFIYIDDKAREKLNRVFGVTDAKKHPFVATFGFKADALRPLPFNPQTIV